MNTMEMIVICSQDAENPQVYHRKESVGSLREPVDSG